MRLLRHDLLSNRRDVPDRPVTTSHELCHTVQCRRSTEAMALASTSATASAAVLKTPFLGAGRALANAANVTVVKPPPRRALVVAAAAPKKSWIPAFKSDAEFINPPWLDGS